MSNNRKSMQTVGIIGCGGFIGSHLLERLIATRQYFVTGIDLSTLKIEHLLPHPNVSILTADVHTFGGLGEWIANCDIVVSLAALCNPSLYNTVPLSVIESNFTLPLQIVDLCAKAKKRLIHFSTCEVYGKTLQALSGSEKENHYLLNEDESPLILGPVHAQRWSYACAKQLLERLIIGYGFEKQLEYTIVRPFNFIGPRMDYLPGIDGDGIPRVLACFMKALLFGEPLKLVDGGKNRRCFTAIEDAVNAVVRIVERPQESRGQIFNIGNPDNEISIRDLAYVMQDLFNLLTDNKYPAHPIETVSAEAFYGKGYEDSDRRVPDIGKARKLLGWEPQLSLTEALRISIFSFIDYYKKEDIVHSFG